MAIAADARASEAITGRRYGRKKPSNRRKVDMSILYKLKYELADGDRGGQTAAVILTGSGRAGP
jgi:hypothetical protein